MSDPAHEMMVALGGKVGGRVDGTTWSCADCDETGDEQDNIEASISLYGHRMRNHVSPKGHNEQT